ncbi:hypothetical protein ABIE09_003656 [Lysobacter enzymogenes]|uniref:GFA family protein n=1 Tax=Lysobacter enzymogenes TaxID=69 RepID=UPI00339656E6
MDPVLYTGGCLCGRVRFEAAGPAGNPHYCSCGQCRKHTGSLAAPWIEFPSERVRWTGPQGRPAIYRSSPHSSRAFCPHCGSALGAIDDAPTIALLLGSLDRPDAPELEPVSHSFEDGKPAWA